MVADSRLILSVRGRRWHSQTGMLSRSEPNHLSCVIERLDIIPWLRSYRVSPVRCSRTSCNELDDAESSYALEWATGGPEMICPLASPWLHLGLKLGQPDVLSTRAGSAAATDWTYRQSIAPKLYIGVGVRVF